MRPSSSIADHVREQSRRTLSAYEVQPNLIREHVGIEDEVLSGGYGHRQIHELVQNGADAILESGRDGRIHVLLTNEALYCANEGSPIDVAGIDAILNSHMSRKSGSQIGQFGLGFKSVLAISASPEFHSSTGSFAFDADWSAQEIRRRMPDAARTPVLRLARPMGEMEIRRDERLSDLLSWATTVVKLPRNTGATDWISRDLDAFPAEFLLFSPHVRSLTLRDEVAARERQIATARTAYAIRVSEGDDVVEWKVFSRDIAVESLSSDALADADRKTRDRSTLPLLWAVPMDRRRSRGRFWAFFPTETETTLSGILNAPWKTNADRQNLLDGSFNRALLQAAVGLISESFPELKIESDPGAVLDALPARAADAAGWADEALIESLEPALSGTACIPDADGQLKVPTGLSMRPDTVVASENQRAISESDFHASAMLVHPTVERRERRARAERLGVSRMTVHQWLEALAGSSSPESSLRAVVAAATIAEDLPKHQVDLLREARIVFTASSKVVAASETGLYLPSDSDEEGGLAVHELVAANAEAREFLRLLGVSEQSASARVDALLSRYDVDWMSIWLELRKLAPADAVALLAKHSKRVTLQVRTVAGHFSSIRRTLLPGSIVPASGERDSVVAIDMEFHHDDLEVLRACGASEVPAAGHKSRENEWYRDYLKDARARYFDALQHGARRPDRTYLSFDEDDTVGPMDPLLLLSEIGRVEMSRYLLPYVAGEGPWTLTHDTRPASFPRLLMEPPVRWMLRRYGEVQTSLGPKRIAQCVSSELEPWHTILPVAKLGKDVCRSLEMPISLADLDDAMWSAAFDQARDVSETDRGSFYSHAARLRPAPEELWCELGGDTVTRPPQEIHLAFDVETARVHRDAGIPSLLVEERSESAALSQNWGLRQPTESLRYIPDADESPLGDLLPGLRAYVPDSAWGTPLQPCERLWLENVGEAAMTVERQFARVGDRLCFACSLDTRDLLARVASEFGVHLTEHQLDDAQQYSLREKRKRLLTEARETLDLRDKLVLLVGVEDLLRRLPAPIQELLEDRGQTGSGSSVAEMSLAVHGVDVLRVHAAELGSRGLEPPTTWAGSPRAQEFVDEIGFPPEYAGFRRSRREPTWDVDGPITLHPLHDFQQTIGSRIQAFLRAAEPGRGLLSLPTGSGKTRVVVQALVESMKSRDLSGTVVWIAQSDELCEQAVQSWGEVWRGLGPAERLRISRLWGQTNNRIVAAPSPHVVVATYQTLVSRLRMPAFAWLLEAACVVVDEAHGSIAPSYTEILAQFGLTAHVTSRFLIGITATPFRSAADPEETQWLVNRYGRRRFDHDVIPGEDPYPVLQEMGILARVDQQVLAGEELTLTGPELSELQQFNRLPASAESRLGESDSRNRRLVESIASLPNDWPVLLFATSVEHAHLMAALLAIEGVSAKAISGETDPGARRHYIEQFRAGHLRVLSNYGVLSTGFDAPALRALYVARPVYSAVLYQQMLGRGLRGRRNGGKDRCLVVNVEDNVAQFGEKLAFHHFEYLWRP